MDILDFLLRRASPAPPSQDDLDSLRVIEPYQRLAIAWDSLIGSRALSGYVGLLEELQRDFDIKTSSVLDLACGTGALLESLIGVFHTRFGLDLSDEMLNVARRERPHAGEFVRGTFLAFDLARSFDLITCTGDSMNYLRDDDELSRVFRSVRRHLEPDGIFVFDALNLHQMAIASTSAPFQHPTGQAWYVINFDSEAGCERSYIAYPDAIEPHERWPIETDQVCSLADAADLEVVRVGASVGYEKPEFTFLPGRTYYVLQRLVGP